MPSSLVFGQGHGLRSQDGLLGHRPRERGNVTNVIPDPDEMLKLNLME